MSLAGWYYLHVNGELIFKPVNGSEPQVERGGFVRKVWPCDPEQRAHAWVLCIEALALGAKRERIDELVEKWQLTNQDAFRFVAEATIGGTTVFTLADDCEWFVAGFADGKPPHTGLGRTALEALAELAKPGLTRHVPAQP